MAVFRKPLNAKEGILLMNSLIDRSVVVQENLILFKEKSNIVNKDASKLYEVTKSWWVGFLDRHKDVLHTRRGERFESSRVNSTKLPFIVQMYDIIYSKMVDARVVTSIEEFFTNKTGEIVSKGEKYGRGNDIKITYPKYIYFLWTKQDAMLRKVKMVVMREKNKSWELITSQGQNATAPTTVSP